MGVGFITGGSVVTSVLQTSTSPALLANSSWTMGLWQHSEDEPSKEARSHAAQLRRRAFEQEMKLPSVGSPSWALLVVRLVLPGCAVPLGYSE